VLLSHAGHCRGCILCYYVELLVYNVAPVARIIDLCQSGYYGLDGLRFVSQMMTFYVLYIMMYSSSEIILCLRRRTVYVTFL